MQIIANVLRWTGLPITWLALGIFFALSVTIVATTLLLVSPLLIFGVGLVSLAEEIENI